MSDKTAIVKRFQGKEGARFCAEGLQEQSIVQGDRALAKALCRCHELEFYKAGAVLLEQGEATNHIIFILAGKVAVKRNNREIAVRGAGHCVGELALIDAKQRRSATIVAKEECVVATVSEPQFTRIAKRFPEIWRRLAKEGADRLRERLEGVRPRNDVAKVFIGSSSESAVVAKAVGKSLEKVAEIIPWTKPAIWRPDQFTFESLEEQARRVVDFAVMVFGPDDTIFSRHKKTTGPRDNVLLEHGLFSGALGHKRTFIIAPANKHLKIPSDLGGKNRIQYDLSAKGDLAAVIDKACEGMRQIIQEAGPI